MAAGKRSSLGKGLKKRQLVDGSWKYEYAYETIEADGRRKQHLMPLPSHVVTDEQAFDWRGKLRVEIEEGGNPAPNGELRLHHVAVRVFAEMEKEMARGVYAEGTVRNYKRDYENHIRPYFKNCRMKDITTKMLIAWLDAMREKPGNGGEKIAELTLNTWWSCLRDLIRDAYEQGDIPTNPCWPVPRRKRPKQQARRSYVERTNELILRDDQMIALLNYMREHEEQYVGITATLGYAGLRLQEAAGLQPSNIDGRRILLSQQLALLKRGEEPRYTKRKEERLGVFKRLYRVIPVMPRLERELIFQAAREPEGSQFLFSAMESPGTRPISCATICRAIARSGERSGVGRVTPKDLRRTAACVFAAAGIERQVASQILGHTPEVYDGSYAKAWTDERELVEVERLLAAYEWGTVEEEAA